VEFARQMVAKQLIGVNRVCFLVGISKKTYYQCKDPGERLETKYQELKGFVQQVVDKHPKYGVDRIKADLWERFTITVGRDTLGQLLKIWGLSLKRKVKATPPSGISKILCFLAGRANLLIRTPLTAPFQVISSDITEVKFAHGRQTAYLASHKDVFGEYVYGWALGLSMTTDLVMQSLTMCWHVLTLFLGLAEPKGIIYHQDRGSQYTSYEYVNQVLDHGDRLSFSDPGTPTHNPGQESFQGRFKEEWADEIYELETYEEVVAFVNAKIADYNEDRIHTSIGNQAPIKFLKKFL
jgi:putative transposase